jgi:polyisoprenoid-binding protein YceI
MTTTTQVKALDRTFQADPVHSSFGFAVKHMDISTFRGTLSDVEATLAPGDEGPVLEGAARVESISIHEPAEFRAHVLGPEFFDSENHPEVTFRSTRLDLADDGSADVEGELTIRGITRAVVAKGTWVEPREVAGSLRAALELETSFDRRDYGFDWQMELPSGDNALDYEVTLTVHLELVSQES